MSPTSRETLTLTIDESDLVLLRRVHAEAQKAGRVGKESTPNRWALSVVMREVRRLEKRLSDRAV